MFNALITMRRLWYLTTEGELRGHLTGESLLEETTPITLGKGQEKTVQQMLPSIINLQ